MPGMVFIMVKSITIHTGSHDIIDGDRFGSVIENVKFSVEIIEWQTKSNHEDYWDQFYGKHRSIIFN